ncbi:hypothetical protein HYU07_00420 [Candidatus Woesearchaeota archaeon]|nr:hypothetical protein [Candidatus Woesearchaeota archaeon]
MPSDTPDKVLQIVRMRGPLLPIVISKEINSNTLFAAAILSDLAGRKLIKISSIKVGGSPLYYAPGQEYKLQNYYNQLNDKEKIAYDMLKDKKVLDEAILEPVIRVSLKLMKDFAVPVAVNEGEAQKVFWKWYLTPQNEADELIKNILNPAREKPEIKIVKEEKSAEEHDLEQKRGAVEEKARKIDLEMKKLEEMKRKDVIQRKLEAEKLKEPEKETKDEFFEKIKKYCAEKKIEILEYKIIKKKLELDLVIRVPSAVGTLEYYCKARDKKNISEADLSTAFIQGQVKKLPVLILATGDLNKKASLMLQNEFKGMNVKKL